MNYSIIGSGSVGMALASQFVRHGISAGVANSRGRDAVAAVLGGHGEVLHALTIEEAVKADFIILAVPFWAHRDVAKAAIDWKGKIIIDVTNAYGVPLSDLGNEPSSSLVAKAMLGARLVKAFNHLPAGVLAQDPKTAEGRRVVFLSSDDEGATSEVANLVRRLGFAPVSLGKIAEGGRLVQAQDKSWAPLIFQDFFKKEV
ncbi:NADPH-dependent F420 reductase [Rhizobium leguminosarum]|uniref:NADPH-dependent F420 reductase n=1 Tax=Rhizobium leguminosarum TaxID=384 RepID=UPI002FF3D8E2